MIVNDLDSMVHLNGMGDRSSKTVNVDEVFEHIRCSQPNDSEK
jgi:hypothetical protein